MMRKQLFNGYLVLRYGDSGTGWYVIQLSLGHVLVKAPGSEGKILAGARICEGHLFHPFLIDKVGLLTPSLPPLQGKIIDEKALEGKINRS